MPDWNPSSMAMPKRTRLDIYLTCEEDLDFAILKLNQLILTLQETARSSGTETQKILEAGAKINHFHRVLKEERPQLKRENVETLPVRKR